MTIFLLAVVAGPLGAQPAASQPTTRPAAPVDAERSANLLSESIDLALEGKVAEALPMARRVAAMNPQNATAAQAVKALETYVRRRRDVRTEQHEEYQYEVERIAWANLAQQALPALEKAGTIEPLRELVKDKLIEAYQDVATSDVFEEASTEEAREMKATSIAKLQDVAKLAGQAADLLKGNDTPYANEFRKMATTLQDQAERNGDIWEQVDPSTLKSRWQAARRVRPAGEKLADAVTDLEVMVTAKPWRIALLHAQLAKRIALDEQAVRQADWYRSLLAETEKLGNQAIEDADWYDALTAYSGLKELEPDNATYRDKVKTILRHVRVLRRYGQEDGDDEQDELSVEEAIDFGDGPAWEEMIHGIDAEMVRTAIGRLGASYVTPVDYRELIHGALQSIKVLAETPQAAKTFPGLKDESKRQTFIEAIDREMENVERKDRVDSLTLQIALNKVLFRSDQTVDIPVGVLAMEFADGLLSELDKFSTMIWPNDVTNFNKSTMGEFTGIGVQITKEPKEPLKVVSPLLGTPAYKAGIKAGDLITAVDGVQTRKFSIDKLIKRIMGPPGSTVVLTIKRRGVAEPFDVPVVRQEVHIRTVKGWQRREDGEWNYILDEDRKIGYIRITQFTSTTHETINKALQEMKQAGVDSLILDLRANPGGLLRSATAVANEFLNSGRIVFTRGRQVPRNEIAANAQGTYLDGRMVVMVDQHSASAAEILSGALKDWGRSMIVGERSYGKGSVQNVIPVRDEGDRKAYLKLTTAYYYLPSGRLLHRKDAADDWGVNPDVEVLLTPRQTRRWLEIRRKTDLLQEFDADLLSADLKRQYQADIQLNTAVLMLEMMKLKQQIGKEQYVAEGERQKAG
jgi:carboxyl-terminal processing protease